MYGDLTVTTKYMAYRRLRYFVFSHHQYIYCWVRKHVECLFIVLLLIQWIQYEMINMSTSHTGDIMYFTVQLNRS